MKQLSFIFWDVGDEVVLTKDIYELANDFSPGGYVGAKGDVVTVKKVYIDDAKRYPIHYDMPYAVAHHWALPGAMFAAYVDEI